MAFALERQSEIKHDILNEELENGNLWCGYISCPKVKSNLQTNKSMRQGFVDILLYINKSLQATMNPITDNVLFTHRDENE